MTPRRTVCCPPTGKVKMGGVARILRVGVYTSSTFCCDQVTTCSCTTVGDSLPLLTVTTPVAWAADSLKPTGFTSKEPASTHRGSASARTRIIPTGFMTALHHATTQSSLERHGHRNGVLVSIARTDRDVLLRGNGAVHREGLNRGGIDAVVGLGGSPAGAIAPNA